MHLDSYGKPPKSLVLEFDGTDDRVHGEQEGRRYSSHYGGYVFLPLYVYRGNHLLGSYLRQVNRTDACYSAATLSLLVRGIRAHWPEVNFVFRGDARILSAIAAEWVRTS